MVLAEMQGLEGGREDCLVCVHRVLSSASWLLIKDWIGTRMQHSIHSLGLSLQILQNPTEPLCYAAGHEVVSDAVLRSASELLKLCVMLLTENGGDVMDGHETLRSFGLAAWTVFSSLDLIKKTSRALEEAAVERLSNPCNIGTPSNTSGIEFLYDDGIGCHLC